MTEPASMRGACERVWEEPEEGDSELWVRGGGGEFRGSSEEAEAAGAGAGRVERAGEEAEAGWPAGGLGLRRVKVGSAMVPEEAPEELSDSSVDPVELLEASPVEEDGDLGRVSAGLEVWEAGTEAAGRPGAMAA